MSAASLPLEPCPERVLPSGDLVLPAPVVRDLLVLAVALCRASGVFRDPDGDRITDRVQIDPDWMGSLDYVANLAEYAAEGGGPR